MNTCPRRVTAQRRVLRANVLHIGSCIVVITLFLNTVGTASLAPRPSMPVRADTAWSFTPSLADTPSMRRTEGQLPSLDMDHVQDQRVGHNGKDRHEASSSGSEGSSDRVTDRVTDHDSHDTSDARPSWKEQLFDIWKELKGREGAEMEEEEGTCQESGHDMLGEGDQVACIGATSTQGGLRSSLFDNIMKFIGELEEGVVDELVKEFLIRYEPHIQLIFNEFHGDTVAVAREIRTLELQTRATRSCGHRLLAMCNGHVMSLCRISVPCVS